MSYSQSCLRGHDKSNLYCVKNLQNVESVQVTPPTVEFALKSRWLCYLWRHFSIFCLRHNSLHIEWQMLWMEHLSTKPYFVGPPAFKVGSPLFANIWSPSISIELCKPELWGTIYRSMEPNKSNYGAPSIDWYISINRIMEPHQSTRVFL